MYVCTSFIYGDGIYNNSYDEPWKGNMRCVGLGLGKIGLA